MPTYTTKTQHDYKSTTYATGYYSLADVVTNAKQSFTTASAFYVSGSSLDGDIKMANGTRLPIEDFVQPHFSASTNKAVQSPIIPFGITEATSSNATTHVVVLST